MNIEEMIEEKCPYRKEPGRLGEHDSAYERELRSAYNAFSRLEKRHWLAEQKAMRRKQYDSSHYMTARYMILYYLIEGKLECQM